MSDLRLAAEEFTAYGFSIGAEQISTCNVEIEVRNTEFVDRGEVRNIEAFPGVYYSRIESLSTINLTNEDLALRVECTQFSNFRGVRLPTRISVNSDFSAHSVTAESIILRIARDLLHSWLTVQGWQLLHMSVASRQGTSVAFLGDKEAGKTPWLLRCLQKGWSYTTNDRAYYHPLSKQVLGFPIVALLSSESLKQLPQELREKVSRGDNRRGKRPEGYQKYSLLPFELAAAFQTSVEPLGELESVYILEGYGGPMKTEQADASDARVNEIVAKNLYTRYDPTYRFALFSPSQIQRSSGQFNASLLSKSTRLKYLFFSWTAFDQGECPFEFN